ncbi:MAG: hypothetical protein EP335_02355 [Alphaproteobacteria bacterium]|nr:MAG: hypothetical protein EP335_02355 [Alphaproteobacteria bacterium]
MSQILFATALALSASTASAAQDTSITDLTFLTGCWAGKVGGVVYEENWTGASGGTLMATSKTLKADKLAFFEFLMIRRAEDGIRFVPYLKGREGANFALTQAGASHVLFTNPDNDFPSAIRYERSGDSLMVTLSSGTHSESYSLSRATCQ